MDTQREADKDWCQGGKAFEICDIPDGGGGSAEGFVLWDPLQDQTIAGDTIRSRIMPKIAEKLGFLMRGRVEVCQKSPIYSIFKAKRLDFGRVGHNIRMKMRQLIVIQ